MTNEPDWSAETHALDHGREFVTALGDVQPVDAPQYVVELVQVEHVTRRREQPKLRINGHRYELDQAADLLRFIQAGLELSRDQHEPEHHRGRREPTPVSP